MIFVSEALPGEPIGIREIEDGHWLLCFADINLGIIDRRTQKFQRFGPGRPPRPKAQPTKTVRDVTGL